MRRPRRSNIASSRPIASAKCSSYITGEILAVIGGDSGG
jgi:hypothetical protein